MLHFKTFLFIVMCSLFSQAQGAHQYHLIEKDKHKIHILIINPKDYDISLVKAHDQVMGRERIGEMAKRMDADIAINAGFFEMGDNKDGMPVSTMINNGRIFGLGGSEHNCLIKNNNNFSIEKILPKLEIKADDNLIQIDKFNKFAVGKKAFYFNHHWGSNTLSAFKGRIEIIIDQDLKIIDIVNHGGNLIPHKGHVLSLPIHADLSAFHIGQQLIFAWTPSHIFKENNFAIMGQPLLIKNNVINEKLITDKDIHARTAAGINKSGQLIMIVAEHQYVKPILDVNLRDIKDIFVKNKISYANLTANDMKKIVLDNMNSNSEVIGLTLHELAELMKEQGCLNAINLDGGGSSSLYIDGKYINKSYGDTDESEGQKTIRPVSDAIVFKERK